VPVPPEQTTKQQREARRAEKVAALKQKQARDKRMRTFGFIGGGVVVLAVIGLVVAVIAVNSVPKVDPDSITIEGLKTYSDLPANHVDTAVDYQALYDTTPPAGGNHAPVWLNCGIYTEAVPNENAVHDLEHGAVWVTYDPAKVTGGDLTTLQDKMKSTYMVLSPFEGLPTPVVASAWGNQVQLDGVDDPRLGEFVTKFWKAASAPEPGAPCTGGVDGPGKIA
jgi:hypothetical protein